MCQGLPNELEPNRHLTNLHYLADTYSEATINDARHTKEDNYINSINTHIVIKPLITSMPQTVYMYFSKKGPRGSIVLIII